MLALYWQALGAEDEAAAGDDAAVADDEASSPAGDAATPEQAAGDGQANPVAAGDAAALIEPQIVPDGAESLGGIAETVHESTVGQVVDDYGGAQFLGVSSLEWALGIGALALALLVRYVIILVLSRYLRPIVERTETEYDDRMLAALKRAVSWLVLLAGIFLAFSFIQLPTQPINWQAGVWRVLNTLIVINIGVLAYRIAQVFLHYISHGDENRRSVLDEQFFPLMRDLVKFAVVLLVLIAIVQNWGYSAAGLLTGVGIGGLALAFAAQDTVANIFGSFVIYSDRPYRVGDWVKIGDVEGTVEEIGIRSTRIRMFDKTLVFMPNKTVANESIQNFSEMPIRRIKVYVGLSYDASTTQIEEVVERTRAMLRDHPAISQGFWMVNFTEMSASSLDMLVYCFTETTVWKEYMDIRQDVLLRIIDICADVGVEIAFPTRTIYHRSPEVHPMAGLPDEFKRGVDEGLPVELRRGSNPDEPQLEPGAGSTRGAEFDTAEGENGES
jgi:MscS family membrane protein